MSLTELLARYREQSEAALLHWLPEQTLIPQRLHQAMRYAASNGGKRVRPALVYMTGVALGLEPKQLDGAACAVELIHAYSLVHDDLPCMDDDDLRRGKPTCHKAFDEATATLVGDALQTLAFQVLIQAPLPVTAARRLQMLETLALATGSRGMAGGQAMDMAAQGQQLNIAELEDMHIHKTGALIRASVKLGALSKEDLAIERLDKLDHYAKCIGLAFQVQDDVLDETADTATLGKTQGSDRSNHKMTYVTLLGLKGARDLARELRDEALHSLQDFDPSADPLRWMADYIVTRGN